MNTEKMELQLKALLRQLETGKVKNVYSLRIKIDRLNLAIKNAKEKDRINNWLSQ